MTTRADGTQLGRPTGSPPAFSQMRLRCGADGDLRDTFIAHPPPQHSASLRDLRAGVYHSEASSEGWRFSPLFLLPLAPVLVDMGTGHFNAPHRCHPSRARIKTCRMPFWCHYGSIMNITVKDVPKDLHERLRSVADETGRSLNKLILITLERALAPRKTDRHELLQRIQARRATMGSVLDDSGLADAIEGGRE